MILMKVLLKVYKYDEEQAKQNEEVEKLNELLGKELNEAEEDFVLEEEWGEAAVDITKIVFIKSAKDDDGKSIVELGMDNKIILTVKGEFETIMKEINELMKENIFSFRKN